jgi:hypothetical protein
MRNFVWKKCITDKDNPDKNAEGRQVGVPKKKLNIFLMSGCI